MLSKTKLKPLRTGLHIQAKKCSMAAEVPMFPYIMKIGSFELRVYSLMLMLAVVIGLYFCSKRAKSLNIESKAFENTVITGFIGGIIGARLYYVAFNWSYFSLHLDEILKVWQGGLAIHGGIALGFLSAVIYARNKNLSIIKFADITAPFMLLGQGIGRFGNFANGEAHGVPTITPPDIIFRLKPAFPEFWNTALAQHEVLSTPSALTAFWHKIEATPQIVMFGGKEYLLKEYVPWGISFPDKYRPLAWQEFGSMPVHPTFFYEMILNLICAAVLIILWRKDSNIGKGKIAALYLIFYGFIRAFVTLFRADDLMLGVIRAPHAASLILVVSAIIWYTACKKINNSHKAT